MSAPKLVKNTRLSARAGKAAHESSAMQQDSRTQMIKYESINSDVRPIILQSSREPLPDSCSIFRTLNNRHDFAERKMSGAVLLCWREPDSFFHTTVAAD